MGAFPKALWVPPGASILTTPGPGSAPVYARKGDIVMHPSGTGWHVCVAQNGVSVAVPTGGLPVNHSGGEFHWSQGASYSGIGVPGPNTTGSTYDQVQADSYGSDGRIQSGLNNKPAF